MNLCTHRLTKNKHKQTASTQPVCIQTNTHAPSALMKINMARGRFSPAPTERDTHIRLCCIWCFRMCVCVCARLCVVMGRILGIQQQGCVHLTAFSMYGNVCAFLKKGGSMYFPSPRVPFPALHTSFPELIDLWMHDRWRERKRGGRGSKHGCIDACMDVYTPHPFPSNTRYEVPQHTHTHAYTPLNVGFMRIPNIIHSFT